MSPALNGSSEIQHFEHADAIEIRDGIMFVFYLGLPHIQYKTVSMYLHRQTSVYTSILQYCASPHTEKVNGAW